ncbi:MAG: RNA polymerase sigma factor [bacterium]|nr:RNA polymerase sigma factor [bacterium]
MYSSNWMSINKKEKTARLESYILRLKQNDKEALAQLYEEIRVSVYSLALSIVKDPNMAEDILQDTIIKIYQSSDLYKPKGKPLAWILTIVKNNALMKLRQQSKMTMLTDEEWNKIPKKEELSKEEIMLLKSSLNKLKDEEKIIITLYAISGLKHREIAELLDLPLATVLSKYHRAIKKLKKIMSEEK